MKVDGLMLTSLSKNGLSVNMEIHMKKWTALCKSGRSHLKMGVFRKVGGLKFELAVSMFKKRNGIIVHE